jgi:hypothetical protein
VRLVADKTALAQDVLRERCLHRHHLSINVQYNSCFNHGIYNESFTGHSSTFIMLLHRDNDEINGTPWQYDTFIMLQASVSQTFWLADPFGFEK